MIELTDHELAFLAQATARAHVTVADARGALPLLDKLEREIARRQDAARLNEAAALVAAAPRPVDTPAAPVVVAATPRAAARHRSRG